MRLKTLRSLEFRELQKEWYDKLAEDGFEDIEWIDHETGQGQNSRFLKNSLPPSPSHNKKTVVGTFASSNRFEYYRLCVNFLHNYCKFNDLDETEPTSPSMLEKTLWSMHSNGDTYREISRTLRSSTKSDKRYSVYWVYYRVRRLQKIMIEWNKIDPEGLTGFNSHDTLDIEEIEETD